MRLSFQVEIVTLQLAADEEVGFKEIMTSPAVLKKILEEKHVEVTPEILKQVPRALADPIMVFKSATVPGSYVSMLELKDERGGTIVVPVALNAANSKQAFMTSVYGQIRKKADGSAEVNDSWFVKQIENGNLRYMNTEKSASWARDVGLQSPIRSLPAEALRELNIPTEADLVKARGENPGFYQDTAAPLGYARFEEAETIVAILKDGNRSTFLHELGHVLLNSRLRLALMEGLDDAVREDWTRLAEWLEVADIDFSRPLSEADEKRWRDAHEKFATGFEKYLMEGKAPSADLARAFRAFRKWLLDIYKAVRNIFYVDADGNRVEFEINDEIRGVMDRMLASEEEIEASRAVREAERLAHILTEQGIPDDVAARYRDVIEEGADAAKAKLMKKLTAELKAEKQAELKEARRAARKQAGTEVWALPEYRALKALRMPREKGGLRLSLPDLTELYGDAGAEALMKELPEGVLANDGISPEVAAELLGYGTPEELLEDLKRAKTLLPQKAIADRVRAATAQLESLIRNPEALRAEAERILHGRERLEWLALETEMLDEAARRAGKRIGDDARRQKRQQEKQRERAREEKAEEDLRGAFGPENLAAMAKAAEDEAKRILAGKRIRDISVPHYMAAEKRASAKAVQAAAAARFDEARQWKWSELVNHALAIEAMRIREEYEKGKKQLERYWPNRKRLRGVIGNEAFDQIIGLLERLGVNPEDPRAKDRPRLSAYLEKMAKRNDSPLPVPQWLQDLDVSDRRLSLSALTFERFQDALDTIRSIEHVGRLEGRLLTAQKEADFAAAVETLVQATVAEHGQLDDSVVVDREKKTAGMFGKSLATLDRIETLLRMADGLKDRGPWWETFYLPAQRAYEDELNRTAKARKDMEALIRKHFPDQRVFVRLLNAKFENGLRRKDGTALRWTGEQLLAAMLNWGNQHNRERLVFGEGFDSGERGKHVKYADDQQYYDAFAIGSAQVEELFRRHATPEMWSFCQDVWDYLDTFWPDIKALEERMRGIAPDKVEALPVRTNDGCVLRGGYYPVRFDTALDRGAQVAQEKEDSRALYENQWRPAATRRGHTKERVERIAPRPLSLSLNVIAEHAGNVIHDLTHRQVVRDLTKLTQDRTVQDLLTHAVGSAGLDQFTPWIQALAAPSGPVEAMNSLMGRLMGNTAAVQLGLKVSAIVGQVVGLVPAAWKLGPVAGTKAVLQAMTFRGLWDKEYRDWAFALSPELADRINGTDRNLRLELEKARRDVKGQLYNRAREVIFVGVGWADMAVSLPVWSAAYDQGLKKFGGDQQKAVDHANYVVRTTQNTGAVKDLARIERDGLFGRVFTMYYSAFGSMYQLFREEMIRTGKRGLPGLPRMAAFCFMMFTLQAVLEDLVKKRTPWDEEEEPDREEALAWVLQRSVGNFLGMFPLVRDMASASAALGGFGGYKPSPVFEAGAAFAKAFDSVLWDGIELAKLAFGEGDWEEIRLDRTAKSLFDAGGYAFGLPTAQLYGWYRTFMRWIRDAPEWSPWELIWAKRGR